MVQMRGCTGARPSLALLPPSSPPPSARAIAPPTPALPHCRRQLPAIVRPTTPSARNSYDTWVGYNSTEHTPTHTTHKQTHCPPVVSVYFITHTHTSPAVSPTSISPTCCRCSSSQTQHHTGSRGQSSSLMSWCKYNSCTHTCACWPPRSRRCQSHQRWGECTMTCPYWCCR